MIDGIALLAKSADQRLRQLEVIFDQQDVHRCVIVAAGAILHRGCDAPDSYRDVQVQRKSA